MKIVKTLTVIALTALLAVGWFTYVGKKIPSKPTYDASIAMADQWVEEDLYQRAILKYQEILPYENTEEIWTKMLNAYELRYAEDRSILSEYITQLDNALVSYPKNVAFVEKLYELHMSSNDYERAYVCLKNAIDNGVNNITVLENAKKLKYSYELYYTTYTGFKSLAANTYAVTNGKNWGCINAVGDVLIDCNYPYVSSVSDTGIRIYDTSLGSRLIDNSGLVMGIFSQQVLESGVFADNLIPVLNGETYSYYDDFAKEVFGGFQFAGSFVNGLAAVQKDGEYFLIDTNGTQKSDKFADIVMDTNGKYLLGNIMIAAKKAGEYQMFDKAGEGMNNFVADKMDLCVNGGWIAFQKDGRWGYVDADGNIKIEPRYEDAKSFSNGLAAVCQDEKWGFINADGELVIDYQFVGADYFNTYGGCMVRTDATDVEDGKLWRMLVLNLGIIQ